MSISFYLFARRKRNRKKKLKENPLSAVIETKASGSSQCQKKSAVAAPTARGKLAAPLQPNEEITKK